MLYRQRFEPFLIETPLGKACVFCGIRGLQWCTTHNPSFLRVPSTGLASHRSSLQVQAPMKKQVTADGISFKGSLHVFNNAVLPDRYMRETATTLAGPHSACAGVQMHPPDKALQNGGPSPTTPTSPHYRPTSWRPLQPEPFSALSMPWCRPKQHLLPSERRH